MTQQATSQVSRPPRPPRPQAANPGGELQTRSPAPGALPVLKGLFSVYSGRDGVPSGEQNCPRPACPSQQSRVCPAPPFSREPRLCDHPLWRPRASRARQNLRGRTTEAWSEQQTHFWKVSASSLEARLSARRTRHRVREPRTLLGTRAAGSGETGNERAPGGPSR